MGKVIRPVYPVQFSFGLLLLIFIFACFLSPQIFDTPIHYHDFGQSKNLFLGIFLASLAVIIMILIIWEEFLFPIRVKLVKGGMIFRNHRTKLIAQLLIYFTIPAIFVFLYFNYDINHVRFFIWAIICTVSPVIEKIVSGLNNYNDFLMLTTREIEYKNNEKEGTFHVEDIQHISIINDDRKVISKIHLVFKNNEEVTIDLDEMELEAFYDYIQKFITIRYRHLLT